MRTSLTALINSLSDSAPHIAECVLFCCWLHFNGLKSLVFKPECLKSHADFTFAWPRGTAMSHAQVTVIETIVDKFLLVNRVYLYIAYGRQIMTNVFENKKACWIALTEKIMHCINWACILMPCIFRACIFRGWNLTVVYLSFEYFNSKHFTHIFIIKIQSFIFTFESSPLKYSICLKIRCITFNRIIFSVFLSAIQHAFLFQRHLSLFFFHNRP